MKCGVPTKEVAENNACHDAGVRMLVPVGRSFWAIMAGYLGLFSLIPVVAPIAIIVSIIAMLSIEKSKNTSKPKFGMGRSIFGLVMGIILTIVQIYFVINN